MWSIVKLAIFFNGKTSLSDRWIVWIWVKGCGMDLLLQTFTPDVLFSV